MKYILILLLTFSLFAGDDVKVTTLKFDTGDEFDVLRYFKAEVDGKTVWSFTTTEGLKATKEGNVVEIDHKMVAVHLLPKQSHAILNLEEMKRKEKAINDTQHGIKEDAKQLQTRRKGLIAKLTVIVNRANALRLRDKQIRDTMENMRIQEENMIIQEQREALVKSNIRSNANNNAKSLEMRAQRVQLNAERRAIPEKMAELHQDFEEANEELQGVDQLLKDAGQNFERIQFKFER